MRRLPHHSGGDRGRPGGRGLRRGRQGLRRRHRQRAREGRAARRRSRGRGAPKAPTSRPSTGAACRRSPTRCRAARRSGWPGQTYTVGDNRLAFGVIDAQGKFVYGKTAVYIAPVARRQGPGPVPGARRRARDRPGLPLPPGGERDRPVRGRLRRRRCVLQARATGRVLTVTQSGGGMLAAPSAGQGRHARQGRRSREVGEAAPKVETDTVASAKGDEESIDTRIPTAPELHQESFADVVGKKPVALLFATPQLCQSRVCGPVTDIALQMKAKYGDKMTFIHQEVYADNDPNKGLRKPLQAVQPALRAVAVRRRRRRQGDRAARGLVRPEGLRATRSRPASSRAVRRSVPPLLIAATALVAFPRPRPRTAWSSARTCRSRSGCSAGRPRSCS